MESWLSISAAARAMGMSSAGVHHLARTGQLRYVTTSLGRLFDPADVERYRRVRESRQNATATAV